MLPENPEAQYRRRKPRPTRPYDPGSAPYDPGSAPKSFGTGPYEPGIAPCRCGTGFPCRPGTFRSGCSSSSPRRSPGSRRQRDQRRRRGDPAPLDALAAAALALECLPLALRRRSPALGLALVSLGFCLDQLRGYHTFAGTALPIALLSAGAHLHRHRRGTAVLFSVAYVPLAVTLAHTGRGGERASGFVTFYLALALAWGVGARLRADRATEAERRRRVADDTRAEERTRIARELHDIVTHHVTAMVVQAEAARYLTAVPERLDETLSAVTDTGRQAITDLRHLLDLLEPSHGPGRSTGRGAEPRTPAAGALRTLVEQARRAGQPVEFTEEGAPAVSAGSADLVAYRVVQEALTNALKHDHGGLTTVR
ncbi:sensor kinase, partial [Streptomyces sp. e14]